MTNQTTTSFDGKSNFELAKQISEQHKSRTVFPSKPLNPNAKPFKLDPPK